MTLLDDRHDRALRERVAPRDWSNPVPQERYNLVVLGAGTAGLVAAAGTAGLGGKVALVERELLGGDCLNHGCVPSKALLRAARAAGEARAASRFGVHSEGTVQTDFPQVMERMRRLRSEIAVHDSAQRFRELGVDVFLGVGRFVGPDALEVGGAKLRFARSLIATGGRPANVPVPGLEEAGYLTNLSLFALTELPKRLLVVGAGPIGCEMAQAFARFGSQVTIISLDPQVLPREDPEAAERVARALQLDGVRLELGVSLDAVETRDGAKVAVFQRNGERHEIVGDELLLAVGRRPNVEDLGLDHAGVEVERSGIVVDERLRTANPRIYAAGDVAGRWQFTHAADAMARIVIRNAFFFGRGAASALTIPWCTYTSPEVAHVGLYAHQEDEAGLELDEIRMELDEIDRAVLDGEEGGFAKVVFEKRSGRLRGATAVASHAGELLGEMCLAVTKRLKVTELSSVVHPYPTQASVWSRLGDAAMRRKLTPGSARFLERWMSWRR